MDIANKIKVANSGTFAYNASVTRQEFKDIISKLETDVDKLSIITTELDKLYLDERLKYLHQRIDELKCMVLFHVNPPKNL